MKIGHLRTSLEKHSLLNARQIVPILDQEEKEISTITIHVWLELLLDNWNVFFKGFWGKGNRKRLQVQITLVVWRVFCGTTARKKKGFVF